MPTAQAPTIDDLFDNCSDPDVEAALVDQLIAHIDTGDNNQLSSEAKRAAACLSSEALERYTIAFCEQYRDGSLSNSVTLRGILSHLGRSSAANETVRRAIAQHRTMRVDLSLWLFHPTNSAEFDQELITAVIYAPVRNSSGRAYVACANSPHLRLDQWQALLTRSKNEPTWVRNTLIRHPVAPIEKLVDWSTASSAEIRQSVVANPNCPLPILIEAANKKTRSMLRQNACRHPRIAAFYGFGDQLDRWRDACAPPYSAEQVALRLRHTR